MFCLRILAFDCFQRTHLQRPFPKHTNLFCVEILRKIFLPVELDFFAQKPSSNVDRGHGMIKSYAAELQRGDLEIQQEILRFLPRGSMFFFKARQINANGGCAWVVYSLVSSTLFPCVCRLNWKNKLSPSRTSWKQPEIHGDPRESVFNQSL